ncbi:MAG: tyrosine--tRNA ligase [Planctomycetota bacterium]
MGREIDLILRGVVEVFTAEELERKLVQSAQSGQPLRVKLGVDPTSPDIHLGHTVVLRKLRAFQDLGHTGVLIIGDYTARVGDPSGRDRTRPRLDPADIERNAATYLEQVRKILDLERIEIVRNGDWFAKLSFDEIMSLASQMTVARLLERDDFSNRYASGNPISLHEFFYPLMQGYDSVMVRSDIELGGTDQTFNLCVGRDFQRAAGQEPQVAVTLPILIGTDGVQKMSKSTGNYIGVTDPANEMFARVMSIPDPLMESYWTVLTSRPIEEVRGLLSIAHPMEAKKELAFEITRDFHGEDAACAASDEFTRVVQEGELPSDITPEPTPVPDEGLWIVSVIVDKGLASSSSEARRLITQGAVSLDGVKITDIDHRIFLTRSMTLRVGKRRAAILVPEE